MANLEPRAREEGSREVALQVMSGVSLQEEWVGEDEQERGVALHGTLGTSICVQQRG